LPHNRDEYDTDNGGHSHRAEIVGRITQQTSDVTGTLIARQRQAEIGTVKSGRVWPADIRRHSVADHSVARAARARMTNAEPSASGHQERSCLGTSKSGALQRRSASAEDLDRPLPLVMAICRCPDG